MERIIQQIITELVEKIIKKTIDGGMQDIDRLTSDVLAECKALSKKIIEILVATMNQTLREDKPYRKEKGLVIKEKDRKRELLTELGTLNIPRDYYYDKRNNSYVYPMDEMIGIRAYERVGDTISAKAVSLATEMSYAKSAAIVTEGKISRQTVRNKIIEIGAIEKGSESKEKKQVKTLHIYADEDHVHMQRPNKGKGKQNQIVPLVTVTEGIEKVGTYRNQTIAPEHFVDETFDTKRLWQSVDGYISKTYDTDYLEKIYIHGDGGKWISNGLEQYRQTEHIMDGFHFEKYMKKITNAFPKQNVRWRIEKAIAEKDKEKIKTITEELKNQTNEKSEKEKVKKYETYLMNNWEAIINLKTKKISGSCTEGQVSHVLSERFSRDPLGWSKTGLGILTTQRVYIKNGGKITADHLKTKAQTITYKEYADKIIQESIADAIDWSIFEKENPIFDKNSGTQFIINQLGSMQNYYM